MRFSNAIHGNAKIFSHVIILWRRFEIYPKAIPYDAHKTFFTFSFFCREEHFFGDKFVLTL